MRLGLILGLNHDIPESKCPDPVIRQHRIRLWWTIYVFDRMYGSKVGWPIQIADDDIHVQMPSDVAEHAQKHQFSDTQLFTANIELAKIIGQVTEKIYSRKPKIDSFLQREQKLLNALKHWAQVLPAHIRLNRETSSPKHLVSLHLQFNQVCPPPICHLEALSNKLILEKSVYCVGNTASTSPHSNTIKKAKERVR